MSKMTLEEFTARLNSSMFWQEFTFSQTKFSPRPRQEVELADGIVQIGDLLYILQLKERIKETSDAAIEERWFNEKVVRKATKQIRDSVRYISDHDSILMKNDRGRVVEILRSSPEKIKKIVVFHGGRALPRGCADKKFHISSSVGFIHILSANDYANVLNYIIVPDDIRRYFEYREYALAPIGGAGVAVDESDILVGYLTDAPLPVPGSRERLSGFIQDIEDFDLSHLMTEFVDRIQNDDGGTDYHKILAEFARVPRSLWREFKLRLMLSLDACGRSERCMPYKVTFPSSSCAFLIASLDPQLPTAGAEGEQIRLRYLEMYTLAAKYRSKVKSVVGLLISKDGNFRQLDWCHAAFPWEYDRSMENFLARFDFFRPEREEAIDSFLFRKL